MLASYLTLNFFEDIVEARAGAIEPSGLLTAISPCSITVFVYEPALVEFRMSYACLDLVGDQLVPTGNLQARRVLGAWPGAITIALCTIEGLERFSLSEGDSINDWWFRPAVHGSWNRDPRSSGAEFTGSGTAPGDAILLIRGDRGELARLLVAIADECRLGDNLADDEHCVP